MHWDEHGEVSEISLASPSYLRVLMRALVLALLTAATTVQAQAPLDPMTPARRAPTPVQHALIASGSVLGGMLVAGAALGAEPTTAAAALAVVALPLGTTTGAVVGGALGGHPVGFLDVLPAAAVGTVVGVAAAGGVAYAILHTGEPRDPDALVTLRDVAAVLGGVGVAVAVPAAFTVVRARRPVSIAPARLATPDGGAAGVRLRVGL